MAKQYNLTPKQYQALWEACGGKCMTCRRLRARCVDHDHKCCPGKTSCGKCVRGLLCGPCNKGVLGHLRDDPAAMRRCADYVENPPARLILAIDRLEGDP
ncbi:endonuclease VII domain-containing protein [Saccharothrix sp. HUAS TT1]|uniref:endonuclease VII domain-containing protein n=1 Tax=Saccharothrix sp. HUAS TT1 TaxID=3231910 RepID=UPI00345C13DF